MPFPSKENARKLALPQTSAAEARQFLLDRREIALIDVREEVFHAKAHPLFAANLPLSRLEFDAYTRLPRKDVPIVLIDGGEGFTCIAAKHLNSLGYSNISELAGGLRGWREAGYELFRDVNSPSKAFGELVEVQRHTPSLSAQQVQQLIDGNADIFIADVRRYEEFQTMSVPGAQSVPGAELVYRLQQLAEHPQTRVIVNCGGRTRSIIGTQSLINAGFSNPVAALRNGTIGWKLAHQELDHGAWQALSKPNDDFRLIASAAARRVADATGVRRIAIGQAHALRNGYNRSVYFFDVRTPDEYRAGHLPGFGSAPGGQLVQETDVFAPVRGGLIVLADNDGTRANMTASWLAQMNWEVYVVDDIDEMDFMIPGEEERILPSVPEIPAAARVSADTLHHWLQASQSSGEHFVVLDFSSSRQYLRAHISGAYFALLSSIAEVFSNTKTATQYVVTASDDLIASLAWRDLSAATSKPVWLLEGVNQAWHEAGYPLENAHPQFAAEPNDYYRRPYEGTEASPESMQAYLDWEAGLVGQLARDSTHGFWVL